MVEKNEELMEAYFNGDVIYKWFYDGRLQLTTQNNTYEIKNSMVGHYVAVKVVYGDENITSEEFLIEAAPKVLPGDANNDGTLDVSDVTAIQMYLAHYDMEINEEALDVNGDGNVDVNDVTALQMILAGYDI
jgi:hypothetical protein